MKQFALAIALVSTGFSAIGQKAAWNWYFGDHAGITFSSGAPVALTDGVLNTFEGVATISDTAGQLLFYTDGITVYNRNHQAMPNGSGLLGDPSATQSGIIVQAPLSDSLYFVFTIDYNMGSNGLRYSVVDMSLDGGLGNVIEKNTLVRSNAKEKITAARHANGIDFWILINDWTSDDIFSYHLSSNGLDLTPVQSSVGPFHGGVLSDALGYMKVNRLNNRLALALWNKNRFTLLDFDNATGLCSNKIELQGNSSNLYKTYGVEFSPDGTMLYGTTMASPFKVLQFNLLAGTAIDVFNSRVILESTASAPPSCTGGSSYHFGALQLGPDGLIYGVSNCESYLNSISNPDSLGSACGYSPQSVSLPIGVGKLGLPNFVSDFILPNVTTGSLELEDALPAIAAYPNPSSGLWNLRFNAHTITGNLEVLDNSGRVVMRDVILTNATHHVLSSSSLTVGTYICRIRWGSEIRHIRLTANL